jgi:hypothetical protein
MALGVATAVRVDGLFFVLHGAGRLAMEEIILFMEPEDVDVTHQPVNIHVPNHHRHHPPEQEPGNTVAPGKSIFPEILLKECSDEDGYESSPREEDLREPPEEPVLVRSLLDK